MIQDLLLTEFERISNDPDVVARFKRFILDLAVRGKLVDQDPSDEPAAHLLERLVEPASTRKRSARTTTNTLRSMDEAPYTLRPGWCWSSLQLLGSTQTGGTPPTQDRSLYGDAVPFIKPGAIDRNEIDYTGPGLSETGALALGRQAPAGTILMVCIGASLGKCGLLDRTCSFNQQINGLSPYEPLLANYLFVVMRSPVFQREAWASSAHGTLPILNKGRWEQLLLPIAPLAEQRRIVAKVEELMALCDQLEAAQKDREAQRDALRSASLYRLAAVDGHSDVSKDVHFFLNRSQRFITKPEHVYELRQSILELAVSGHLVPQSHGDQPAAELLHEIELREASSLRSRRGHAAAAVTQESPERLPTGWISTAVSQLFRVTGGIQKQPKRSPMSNAFPYLGVSNVQRGRLDLRNVSLFELFPGELEKYRLEPGDLLAVEGNGSPTEIGRCALWNGEIADCVHQNHIIRCRPLCEGIEQFTLLYLNSPSGTATMRRLAITSAGLYSLSVGKIQRITIPVPPLSEQRRIVTKVDELTAVCDELEQALSSSDFERGRLLEALLHETLAEGRASNAGAGAPVSS